MTDEAALLQAIIAEPDDDAPRLVYADWLEEHGRPERGEFIRLQCDEARLPSDDPRRAGLATRLRRLQAVHERDWVEPYRSHLQGWAFHRGFIERVSAGARQFLTAAPPFAAWPIRHVTLHRARRRVPAILAAPYLSRLRTLDMKWNHLDDEAAALLALSPALGHLELIDLFGNDFTDEGRRLLQERFGNRARV
jgi:uncharacterized protein (TIGR02996 family)